LPFPLRPRAHIPTHPLTHVLLPLLAALLFLPRLAALPLDPDESQWIADSHYLELFLSGDTASPLWQENFTVLTQPPLVRYVVGAGRRLGGYGPGDLNAPWDFSLSPAANLARGAVPEPRLLWWARLPMALLAILSAGLVLRLAARAAGPRAGLAAALLFVLNGYLNLSLRQAMAESITVAAILAGLCAADAALRRWRALGHAAPASNPSRALVALSGLGLSAGLAAGAKMNTGLIALLVPAVAPTLLLAPGPQPRRLRLRFVLLATLLTGALAAAAFVAPNPFLYPDPIQRARQLVRQRVYEMSRQVRLFPQDVIRGPADRARFLGLGLFQDYAALAFPGAVFLNLPLCALGLFRLARPALRWLRRASGPPTPALFILAAAFVGLPPLLTPLKWPRYLVLPELFVTVFIGVGLAHLLYVVERLVRRRSAVGRRPARAA
jgi:4-amino-4-deoxy-L-arabinose transferase-like glycosyltransferase